MDKCQSSEYKDERHDWMEIFNDHRRFRVDLCRGCNTVAVQQRRGRDDVAGYWYETIVTGQVLKD